MIIEPRSTTNLRLPRSVGTNVWPARGGLAIHWGGDHQAILPTTPHATCRTRLRAWQDYHMDVHGWVDIAYNWVICQHGIVMLGRGWGVRSAANGTNDSNDRYLAACWMGGEGDQDPSVAAVTAFTDLVAEIRKRGAGHDVEPHRFFFSTDCPGPFLTDLARSLRQQVSPHPEWAPAFPLPSGWYFGPRGGPRESVSGYYPPAVYRSALAQWQVRVGLVGDGLYGPRTATAVQNAQRIHKLTMDGLIGPKTWAVVWT